MISAFSIIGCVAMFGATEDPVRQYIHRTMHVSSFKRTDADLNGDGRPETFVYLTDQDYCGSSGCSLLILSPTRDSYRVVMRTTATQLPIRLLPTSTKGWHDIAVTVAGGGILKSYLTKLRFDGRRYPSNPTVSPAIPLSRPVGRVLIAS
jgi:hypothetical protein